MAVFFSRHVVSGLVALATVGSLCAGGSQIPIDQLPVAVFESMGTAVPGATYSRAEKKQELGMEVYEIMGKTSDGRKLRLVMSKEGRTLDVSTDVNLKEVPQNVVDTLNRWLKGFQTSAVTRSVRDGGTRVWYEFDGVSNTNQKTVIEIRADGKKVVIEEKQ